MSISVVMATYNGAEYLVEQLDSICRQLSKDDELIICDDCSKDNTVEIINEYIKNNDLEDFISLNINQENLGFQNNFNKAMNLATKDYIFFSDQDDIWLDGKMSEMVSIMESHKDCRLLCCDYEPYYMVEGKTAPKEVMDKMPNDGSLEKISFDKKSIYIGQLGCCMCISREFRDSLKDFWFDGWAQDDRCWRMALCDDGLYMLHKNYVLHRIHGNNTATYGKYHTLEKRCKLFQQMVDASEQMLRRVPKNSRKYKILLNNKKMMELRLEQMKKRKLLNSFKLIKYLSYYQRVKSFAVEGYITIRGV